MTGKRLIAGIGNIFLGDDAFGVVVARRLAAASLPDGVRVTDFGIRGYDLACALLQPWDEVILVDALARGGEPGTVYVLQPDPPAEPPAAPPVFDPHALHPAAVLQMVHALGGEVNNLLVVGCEPASLEPDPSDGDGLSPPARAAVEAAIRIVYQRLHTRGDAAAADSSEPQGEGICPPEKLSAV